MTGQPLVRTKRSIPWHRCQFQRSTSASMPVMMVQLQLRLQWCSHGFQHHHRFLRDECIDSDSHPSHAALDQRADCWCLFGQSNFTSYVAINSMTTKNSGSNNTSSSRTAVIGPGATMAVFTGMQELYRRALSWCASSQLLLDYLDIFTMIALSSIWVCSPRSDMVIHSI